MIRLLHFVGLAMLCFAAAVCSAAPPGSCVRCEKCLCPDDYCPKPLPWVPCLCRPRCLDEYCPKPWPCPACRASNCCPDDYCSKPFLMPPPRCYERWFRP